jgi:hypothetical protein
MSSNTPSGSSGSRPPGSLGSGVHPVAGNSFSHSAQSMRPVVAPPRSNALVFVLIAILLGAIGALAYLVLTK